MFVSAMGAAENKACASMWPLVVGAMPNLRSLAAIVGVGLQLFEENK